MDHISESFTDNSTLVPVGFIADGIIGKHYFTLLARSLASNLYLFLFPGKLPGLISTTSFCKFLNLTDHDLPLL